MSSYSDPVQSDFWDPTAYAHVPSKMSIVGLVQQAVNRFPVEELDFGGRGTMFAEWRVDDCVTNGAHVSHAVEEHLVSAVGRKTGPPSTTVLSLRYICTYVARIRKVTTIVQGVRPWIVRLHCACRYIGCKTPETAVNVQVSSRDSNSFLAKFSNYGKPWKRPMKGRVWLAGSSEIARSKKYECSRNLRKITAVRAVAAMLVAHLVSSSLETGMGAL